MSIKWKGVLFALLMAGLGGLALGLLVPREPVFQGKRLSWWLKAFDNTSSTPVRSSVREAEAVAALRQMGTNALPFLYPMRLARDSRLKAWVRRLLLSKQNLIRLDMADASSMRWKASRAFWALGPVAAPLVPELMRIFADPNQSEPFDYSDEFAAAKQTLLAIGSPAVLPVCGMLTNQSYAIRFRALYTLHGSFGTNGIPAIPALMRCLNDADYLVRQTAESAIVVIAGVTLSGWFRSMRHACKMRTATCGGARPISSVNWVKKHDWPSPHSRSV